MTAKSTSKPKDRLDVRLSDENFVVWLPRDADYFIENWKSWERGDSEQKLFEFITDESGGKDVFFDIGAWIGAVSLLASRKFRQVFCFEADPVSVGDLTQNLAMNKITNVTLVPKFVGKTPGVQKLYSIHSGNNSGSSMFHTDGMTSWDIPVVVLGDFIAETLSADEKLVLKMDIEGAEYGILPGLAPLFASGRVRKMCLSLHPTLLAKSVSGQSLIQKLKRRGLLLKNTFAALWATRHFTRKLDANGVLVTPFDILWEILTKGSSSEQRRELYLFDPM